MDQQRNHGKLFTATCSTDLMQKIGPDSFAFLILRHSAVGNLGIGGGLFLCERWQGHSKNPTCGWICSKKIAEFDEYLRTYFVEVMF